MLFTPETLATIVPRSYPYFITESGSPGFAVKVLKTGALSFYFRKKAQGKRVDIPLGQDLELARLRYMALLSKEEQQKERAQVEALGIAPGGIHLPALGSASGHGLEDEPSADPVFFPGITFPVLIGRFLKEHVEPNLRPSTARNYVLYLEKAQKELADSDILKAMAERNPQLGPRLPLWASQLIAGTVGADSARQLFRAYIHHLGKKTPALANRMRETLSSCFKWGVLEDLCRVSPVHGIRVYKEQPKTRRFTQAELPAFFRSLDEGEYRRRTVLCLKLILATGLRAGEALGIRRQDIDFQEGALHIPQTKSDRPFLVPLTPLTRRLLKEAAVGKGPNARLFPVGIYGLAQVCRRAAKKANLLPCTSHDLRRTFGTMLGELGVNVQVIGRCLNHSAGGSVTTKHYALHDMREEKLEALTRQAERLEALGCVAVPGEQEEA